MSLGILPLTVGLVMGVILRELEMQLLVSVAILLTLPCLW